METLTKSYQMNGSKHKVQPVQPSSKIMKVTPAMAQEFLLKNLSNRPIRKDRVANWLDQMRKGKWTVNNDGICFDWDGNLLNGQHRLTAVVQYGKPVDMLVLTGLHPDSFANMDNGLMRAAGDALNIAGIDNSNAKAAIIRFYLQFKKNIWYGASSKKQRIANNEILEFAKKNEQRVEEVYIFSKKIFKTFKQIPLRYLGALYWLLSDISNESANEFFEKYGTGLDLKERHPVYVLRSKLLVDVNSLKKFNIEIKLYWFILAWNYYRKGQSISKFRGDNSDGIPKPI